MIYDNHIKKNITLVNFLVVSMEIGSNVWGSLQETHVVFVSKQPISLSTMIFGIKCFNNEIRCE